MHAAVHYLKLQFLVYKIERAVSNSISTRVCRAMQIRMNFIRNFFTTYKQYDEIVASAAKKKMQFISIRSATRNTCTTPNFLSTPHVIEHISQNNVCIPLKRQWRIRPYAHTCMWCACAQQQTHVHHMCSFIFFFLARKAYDEPCDSTTFSRVRPEKLDGVSALVWGCG